MRRRITLWEKKQRPQEAPVCIESKSSIAQAPFVQMHENETFSCVANIVPAVAQSTNRNRRHCNEIICTRDIHPCARLVAPQITLKRRDLHIMTQFLSFIIVSFNAIKMSCPFFSFRYHSLLNVVWVRWGILWCKCRMVHSRWGKAPLNVARIYARVSCVMSERVRKITVCSRVGRWMV